MSWYKGFRLQWKEIIETVASDSKRTTQMIEKDTIQSMILNDISQSGISLVFKGGTSLSKAFNLINRFSEDIDLSMDHRPSEAEREQANKTILHAGNSLGLKLLNPHDIHSRYRYNKYVFEYDSLFSNSPLELLVESNLFQPSFPSYEHKVSSFVAKYCNSKGIILPIPFEGATLVMPVQSLERTFIEKIFAICDYSLQNTEGRNSRHLYDIAKLLPFISFTQEFKDMINIIRKERSLSTNNPSAQQEYDINSILTNIIDNRIFESDYNMVTRKLLFEEMSYDEAINNGISIVATHKLF